MYLGTLFDSHDDSMLQLDQTVVDLKLLLRLQKNSHTLQPFSLAKASILTCIFSTLSLKSFPCLQALPLFIGEIESQSPSRYHLSSSSAEILLPVSG